MEYIEAGIRNSKKLAGVGCGEANVYNGKSGKVFVAEWNEFCLLNVSSGWCKVQADYYRPITKHHFVLPTKSVPWIDLPKRLRKVTDKLLGVVINLFSVRFASTMNIRQNEEP